MSNCSPSFHPYNAPSPMYLSMSVCVCFCDVPVGAEVDLVGHKGQTSAANTSGFQNVDRVWVCLVNSLVICVNSTH